jgi:hypothetical protein
MPDGDGQIDRDIADAERAVAEEAAHIRSMNLRGLTSQAAIQSQGGVVVRCEE